MDFVLYIYFCIVFLGLQGIMLFEKNTSIALIMTGNILIIYHSIFNGMIDLLILTILMMIAQISRLYRGV